MSENGDPESDAAYIRSQLDFAIVTGRYSSGLVNELDGHVRNRTANIFQITDEIAWLESDQRARETKTKPASLFNGAILNGLWHKHYFQARFIPQNIQNHWEKNSFIERIAEIAPSGSDLTPHKIGQIARA